KEDERRRISLSIKQALPDWEERQERARAASERPRPRREFEREFGPKEEEPPPMPVDASLEAILQELKERGIGRRCRSGPRPGARLGFSAVARRIPCAVVAHTA